MAEQKLTLKILAGRLDNADSALSLRLDRVEDHIRQWELDSTRPKAGTPEYVEELVVVCINVLYNQRSQGAWTMAKQLEATYFEGRNMQIIGDRVTEAADLLSASPRKES